MKKGSKRARAVRKVPVMLQMEMVECGAASLAMVLAYHKKWLPLEEVRAACGVSRDGSTALSLVKAARTYGCTTKANSYSVEQLMERAKTPCIIHWNFNHFVVFNGAKGGYAHINDPARGVEKIPMAQFAASFTGICLEIQPGEDFERGGQPTSVWRFAWSRLRKSRTALIAAMWISLLAAFVGLLSPVFSKVLVDRVLPNGGAGLGGLMGAMLALAGYGALILGLRQMLLLKIKGKLAIVSAAEFFRHALRLPMEFYAMRMAGDIMGRQASGDDVAETLISRIAPMLMNIALVLCYFAVMIRYSAMLTAVGIVMMLLNGLLARYIANRRVHITRTSMRDAGKLYAATVAGIEMVETIKSSGAEGGFFARWAGYHAAVIKSETAFTKLDKLLGGVPELLLECSSILILTLGAWLVMRGEFTLGMLLAFQTFMAQFLGPVNELTAAGESIQQMRTAMERIEDVMKYPEDAAEETGPTDLDAQKLTGQIEIKSVSFGYAKLAKPLVTDFSMTLKRGAKVAFVGGSGCGKSTLVKLIAGLYAPWEGEILFDGLPKIAVPRSIFTASVAVVDQDISLFEDSVSNNMKMWDDSIEDFEVILAARDVMIHEDIMGREQGYATKLLEGGRNFSGGQRQRMEIARALAQDPTILILDEATSALDAQTEYQVMEAIARRNITTIVVAHRLSTIRDCDEIIVMDGGKIAQRGTHEQLMVEGGLYARLVTTE